MHSGWCGFLLLALLVPGGAGQLADCGTVIVTRIVGGRDAIPGGWPWQISLHRNGFHTCGGSLINSQYVLCAAHCFPTSVTANLEVLLGLQTQEGTNDNLVRRTVAGLMVHENYNTDTNDNDIALLRLSAPVTFNNFIRPVCLAASGSDIPAGTDFIITGWGTIGSGEPLPSPQTLQEVSVPVVSNEQCSQTYSVITTNMICAGLTEGGRDSCQGDSGGPMVSLSNFTTNVTRWVQGGVVSFGIGCALPGIPGVYARVSEYQDWITDRVGSDVPGFVDFRASTTPTIPLPSTSSGFSLLAPLLLSLLPTVLSVPMLL
ncbi:trypsin-1-like [Nerophis ophidion]|uniref:trypsin-1-like n=1 Tax=Nerophis ophidion TaxID=159077 RepID=UPI002ADF5156|nr:trypsin-1-like [Nerophis ophidion]